VRSTLLKAKMYWYVFTEAVALFSLQVAEFDTPNNLYRNQQSYFSRMISASMGNLFETEL
jgi:hypothetical protein